MKASNLYWCVHASPHSYSGHFCSKKCSWWKIPKNRPEVSVCQLFPFLWFNFFELSCFIFLNLLTSGWCLWGSAPVLTVLGDMDGVLIDVWTSVHCLEQDLGHQAGLNKSCSRRLGRKNSNRHMPLWLRLYKKKSFQTVLDDLEPCMGVVDGIDMVPDDVWRSLHCLIKILATRPD